MLDASVDVEAYRKNRDLFYDGLKSIGYDVIRPEGAFFLFPKTPIPNDLDFVTRLQAEQVLSVPGLGFSRPGLHSPFLRRRALGYRATLPRFEKVFRECAMRRADDSFPGLNAS
ncbi:MAG: aminotransferase class I/II-fold pyridoxal phosphate-dependent enzyme [Planctomycetota bacterium]